MVLIKKYLDPNLVCHLQAATRDEALKQLVEKADEAKLLQDKDAFYQAVLNREKVVSTGIGLGVAIPHAKLPAYDHFFILVGILDEGLDWNALDQHPVRLVFLIGGPDDKQTEYLQILSALTLAVKDEERRRQLLRMEDPQEIVALFDEKSGSTG